MLIANRGDGLGERLCAIMNCALLAHYSGRDFKFAWPTINVDPAFHSIYDVNEIFAESFIKKHFIPENMQQNGMHIIDPREESLESIVEKADSTTYFATPQGDISRLKGLEGVSSAEMAAVCRETVLFSDRVLELKHAVDDVPSQFFDQLIHLRSGDILHGAFRNRSDVFKKVIPAPIVAYLIEKSIAAGGEVRLVGQDLKLIQYFSSRFDLLRTPSSFALKESDFDRVFLDIFQFSRAYLVYTGGSGFTRFAAKYNDVNIKMAAPNKSDLFNFIFEEVENVDGRYPRVQLAQGLYFCFDYYLRTSSYEDLGLLINKCLSFDNRPIFHIFEMLNSVRFGIDYNFVEFNRRLHFSVKEEARKYNSSVEKIYRDIDISLERGVSKKVYLFLDRVKKSGSGYFVD